jgi:hypothetical protein
MSHDFAYRSDPSDPVIGNPGIQMLAIPGLLVMANAGLLLLAVHDYIRTRIGVHHVHRDLELRIKGHLYEITEVNEEVLGSEQGLPMSVSGYRKTLRSVADRGDSKLMDQVAESIEEHIRTHEDRPENQTVRRDARMLLTEQGIAPDSYLNRA